ncbi:penicillin-binding protein [Actinotalea sp. BY-33]|uniref:Penicillin-binding protein n=1 Tax=Actinotalea soli TaxID=2819234 RepID=A0A939LV46_9CELL|nr:penicillin-binding transpeptidase domain-containing protein [Actinotalea soli]MBO1751847.1 penicillin-binding protein [Actinotalea soli]
MTISRGNRPTSRAAVVGAVAVLVGAGLVGCTAEPPAPDDTAAALATGISRGDLTGVPLGDTDPTVAEAQIEAVAEGLGVLPVVAVGEVTVDAEDPSLATATLDLTWDLDDSPEDWTTSTTADLTLVEDEWQATWEPALLAPDLREDEVLTLSRTAAERADVLGADGAVLVEDRPVLRLGLDKTRVDPSGVADAAREIASYLELDPEAFAERATAAGERAFVEALVVREEDPGVDVGAFQLLTGSNAVGDSLPLAPSRTFARPLLGTAGPATAEIVEESGGEISAGDMTGLSGLQRQYDAQLRGAPGLTVRAVAEERGVERLLYEREPVAGEPLLTTLDPAVQNDAEAVLSGVPSASAAVVVQPSTGAVLAAASGPGSDGYSTATLGTYAPGSIFKVVSALALLREGVEPSTTVSCPTTIEVEGRTFTNFPGYPAEATGEVPLSTAVAHSCNTAFIGERDLVPDAALAEAAASLGLGGEPEVGYPAFLGSVPQDLAGTDHAASMIGQGRIQVSPLAAATMMASVVRGETVAPWLVGSEPPAAVEAESVTAQEAEQLGGMLRGVVTEGGATFLGEVPGEPVIAKTGTAQFGSGEEAGNHAWIVAAQGDLAVAIFVEDGDYGSTTAGPLLAQLLGLLGG